MVTHACFLAVLIGISVGGAERPPQDRGPSILSNRALADIDRVCVVLARPDVVPVGQSIDTGRLKNQVVAKLMEGGIGHVEQGMDPTARLIAHIEMVAVPDCGKYVYRVQTSLDRLVMLPNRRDLQVQAQVWQSGAVMELVAGTDVPEAIADAVLEQTEAFAGVCKAARLQDRTQTAPQKGSVGPAQAGPQNLQRAAEYPFVASRSSSVFHRSDCRWARNISESNRVGYETREQAIQAGKRPCKTCKP